MVVPPCLQVSRLWLLRVDWNVPFCVRDLNIHRFIFVRFSWNSSSWLPREYCVHLCPSNFLNVSPFPFFMILSVQLLSHVRLFVTPWIAACQASLSITNSQSSPKLMCIKSVMPSSHLILCRPLLLLPPIPPSIKVFSNESTLHMRWSKYWSFSFSINQFFQWTPRISLL